MQGWAVLDDGNAAATTPYSEVELKDSPRGPIKSDHLGNVIGNFYVRHCKKVNGKLVNMTVKTYHDVSQFRTYDEKKYLTQPACSRDLPPLKS